MDGQSNQNNLPEEIRELEEKLAAKKREFAERNGGILPDEKEIFRSVFKDHVEKQMLTITSSLPQTHPLPPDLAQKTEELKKADTREAQVGKLIEIALTHSIQEALKAARKATPWLLDDFHDHLADDFYEKLVQLRKISEDK